MHKRNWHQKATDQMTRGDRVSDSVAQFIGSWKGIIISNAIVIVWITFNVVYINGLVTYHWDKYPFILLNLVFSWQAYNSAPLIMMSQNRQATKDKIQAEHQYEHQEKELLINTELTKEVHKLVSEVHAVIANKKH